MTAGTVLGKVEVCRNDQLHGLHFLFGQVVFRHRNIALFDFAVGSVLPCVKPHVRLFGIGTLIDQFCRRMAMHGIVHLVLYLRKELFCGQRIAVIIQRSSVNVSEFLIEVALRNANLPDALQLLFKVFLGQDCAAVFQAFFIHGPALDSILLHDLICPDTEPHRPLVVHLEANRNNHLQIIVIHAASNLSATLILNYSEFPNSCRLVLLMVSINLFDMLIDGRKPHIVKGRHHLLRQPDVFILVAHLNAVLVLARRGNKGQVFRRRRTYQCRIFLFAFHLSPRFLPRSGQWRPAVRFLVLRFVQF